MKYQTTKEIEFACIKHVWNGGSYLIIPNVKDGFFGKREADLLVITPSNYLFEIEIKISMADLKKMVKKIYCYKIYTLMILESRKKFLQYLKKCLINMKIK